MPGTRPRILVDRQGPPCLAPLPSEVTGLCCEASVAGIKRVLGSMEGVEGMEVEFPSGRTVITYFPGRTTPGRIRSELQALGFGVRTLF